MKIPPCPVCGAQHWPHCRRRIPSWVRDRYPLEVCPMTKEQRAHFALLVDAVMADAERAAAADPPPF